MELFEAAYNFSFVHHRFSFIRDNAETLERLQSKTDTRFVVVHAGRALYNRARSANKRTTQLAYFSYSDVKAQLNPQRDAVVFLGVLNERQPQSQEPDGQAYFAVEFTQAPTLPAGQALQFCETRPTAFELAHERESAIVAQSVSLLDWHRRYRFCPACAQPLCMPSWRESPPSLPLR